MKLYFFASLLVAFLSLFSAADAVPSSDSGTSGNSDKLIDQMLTVSGMKQSLQEMSAEAAMGFVQAALLSGAGEDEKKELAITLEQAFPKDVFVNSVIASLKMNYDEERFRHFMQLVSTPLALKMTKLEARQPAQNDIKAFFTQISKKPLSSERIKLIRQLDTTTHSGDMFGTMMMASLEAGALAAGGDCRIAIEKIKRVIEKSRPAIEKTAHNRAEMILAFTYRDVSDAELGDYLKLYEDKDSKWIDGIVEAAIAEQFKLSMNAGAQGMRPIILAHRPKKTMFAPKCGQPESPGDDEFSQSEQVEANDIKGVASNALPAPKTKISKPPGSGKPVFKQKTVTQPKANSVNMRNKTHKQGGLAHKGHRYPVPGRDLRDCLNYTTNAEIIACTER